MLTLFHEEYTLFMKLATSAKTDDELPACVYPPNLFWFCLFVCKINVHILNA